VVETQFRRLGAFDVVGVAALRAGGVVVHGGLSPRGSLWGPEGASVRVKADSGSGCAGGWVWHSS
jgi:hypothetical protein